MVPEELGRRAFHTGGAVFPGLYLAGFVTWSELRLIYLAGVGLAILLEFLRLVIGLDWWPYRRLTREYERSNPAGYALYTVSSAAVVIVFAAQIAVPAVLMLALADPVSGHFSADELRTVKRPPVLLVMFGLCLAIAVPFLPILIAAVGALAATVADGVTPVIAGYVLDDNITIPVAAATTMFLALQLAA